MKMFYQITPIKNGELVYPYKKMLGILLLLCAFQINSRAQNPNPSSSVDALIQSEMTQEKLPGVATIIVKDGAIVWIESYGFADIGNNILVQDSTVFLLASISKVFTGTAVMQLFENGIIDLDEDINNHLPFNVDNPNFVSDSITFRDIMTHSSSIQDNGPVMDTYYDYPDPSIALSDVMELYFSITGADYDPVANFLSGAPGSTSEYSNIATALNGYLVESATGMPFDDYCDNNIFEPLCMNKTAWHMADFDTTHVARPYQYTGGNYVPYAHYGFADYPDGQLRSNVSDLGNFMIAYLNGGTFGGSSILNQTSINEMWSLQIPDLDPLQGLNWYQEEIFHSNGSSMLWGHNGGESGASTDMYLDPVNNIGICVLTNGEGDALSICDELYDYVLSLNPSSSIIPECEMILAVELVDFRATQKRENTVSLYWKTVNETNNEGFKIQRSSDGRSWESRGFVAGNGSTVEAQLYSFIDNKPLFGLNYYRLQQMDFDGQSKYSPIVNIRTTDGTPTLWVYPNPVQNGELTLYLAEMDIKQINLKIFNSVGKLVKMEVLESNETKIQVNDLPKGMYFFSLNLNNQIHVSKVIIP